jgi:tetratricopeptide (TPR) repeat protein
VLVFVFDPSRLEDMPLFRSVRRAMPLAVVPLLAALSRPAHAADDPRTLARESYARGVALANAGDYQRALSEFQRAYELSPHYAVLYNVAQAERALGHSGKALEAFESYLRLGDEQITPERRSEVEAAIEALKADDSTAEHQPAPVVPPPQAGPVAAAPAQPRAKSGADASAGCATPGLDCRAPSVPAVQPSDGGQRTLGYALGILGLGLGGAAVAHWRWNDGRYDDWKTAYDAYQEHPDPGAIDALNERSQSIERASRVSVGLGIGAAVSFGAGVVLLLTNGNGSHPKTSGAMPCAVAGLGFCSRW